MIILSVQFSSSTTIQSCPNSVDLCCPGMTAVVYGWILFCSTFRRHLLAASTGEISLAVRWTVSLERSFTPLYNMRSHQTHCSSDWLLKMLQTDGDETPSRREFNHRSQPSSPHTIVLKKMIVYKNTCVSILSYFALNTREYFVRNGNGIS